MITSRLLPVSMIALLCALISASAQERTTPSGPPKFVEKLDIGISTTEIAISSDFSGADITVFGAIDSVDDFLLAIGAYDVIVALEGPHQPATVRRKERVAGIWINRHSISFSPIPASYSISSTRPLDSIASKMELAAHNVGISNIRLIPKGAIGDGSLVGSFRDALRRIMQARGLYQRAPSGVRFISRGLFKASVRLPANIPVGAHNVRAELYRNGEFVTEQTIRLHVVKTGLEQFTYNFAHRHSLLYGMFAVAFALLTGWLSSIIFRKD